MDELSKQEFNWLIDIMIRNAGELQYCEPNTIKHKELVAGIKDEQERAKAAYAAALARIATLEAQLTAKQEQIDRLLSEAAHS